MLAVRGVIEFGKRTVKVLGRKKVLMVVWAFGCLCLCLCDGEGADPPPCLDDGELAFLRRLSSCDLFELGELVGVASSASTPVPVDSAEWDSVVVEGVRCLPADAAALLREALAELGHQPTRRAPAAALAARGPEELLDELPQEQLDALARDAVDLVVDEGSVDDAARRAHETRAVERLQVPRSCWDANKGPQVFFADPPVHLDPADPTRHLELDAGSLSERDFPSELVRFRAGVCFPPGAPVPPDRACTVWFSHAHMPTELQNVGERYCSAPYGRHAF
jgi:hypothetical protein